MYHLNLSIQDSSVKYIHIVVQSICKTVSSCKTKTLSPFLPPPAPGNKHSTFCLCEFDNSR